MQFFPSDEIITSLIKTGAKTLALPSGSKLRVGGLSYELSKILHLDFSLSGLGGLDASLLQGNSFYYIYVVVADGEDVNLVASLNAEKPEGFNCYRRIGRVNTDQSLNITVVSSEFVTEVQQSQIETMNYELSLVSNKNKLVEESLSSQALTIKELQDHKQEAELKINSLIDSSDLSNLALENVLNKINNLESESSFNTESLVLANNKIKDIDTILIDLAVSVASRQSEYLSLKDLSNIHASRLNILDLKFNSNLGHRHDGKDSPLIDVVDLGAAGGESGNILSINSQNKLQWIPSGLSFKKEIPLSWVLDVPSSPSKTTKTIGSTAAFSCYELKTNQKLFSSFKIPVEFTTGNKVKLNFTAAHEGLDSLKTYQFCCSFYLIKKDSDPNSVSLFTLRIGPELNAFNSLQIKEHSFVVTTDGKIDGQDMSAGDMVYVTIERVNTGEKEDSSSTIIFDNGLSVVIES